MLCPFFRSSSEGIIKLMYNIIIISIVWWFLKYSLISDAGINNLTVVILRVEE